jgi:hypothetical protein
MLNQWGDGFVGSVQGNVNGKLLMRKTSIVLVKENF